MGLYATCLSNGPPVLRDATVDSTLVTELQERIEEKRETITAVPGTGSVLGVWGYGGNIYAFRNKTGGATSGMYKSTSAGWSEVDLGTVLNFNATTINGEMVIGAILTGAGGASGTIAGVSYNGNWDTGGQGTVVLTSVTGTFVDGEALSCPTLSFDGGIVEISDGDTMTVAVSPEVAPVIVSPSDISTIPPSNDNVGQLKASPSTKVPVTLVKTTVPCPPVSQLPL
jgi:hypothetical protein